MKHFLLHPVVNIINFGFSLKLNHAALDSLEITIILSFFGNYSRILKKEKRDSNSENIEDFRKVQRQNYRKIAKVSLKPFNS